MQFRPVLSSLCSPGWSRTCKDPPASASQAWDYRTRGDQRNSCPVMGQRAGEAWGPVLGVSVSSGSRESLSYWNLDSEMSTPESKNLPRGRNSSAGDKNYMYLRTEQGQRFVSVSAAALQNCLEISIMQLMLELSLSDLPLRRAQSSKQGIFQLWSYPFNNELGMENREFENSSVEAGFDGSGSSTEPCTLSHPASTWVSARAASHTSLPTPSFSWSYTDGDFFKGRNELQVNSCSTTENTSGEALPTPACNQGHGNSSVEENLTDESDLSENEKASDTLLSYTKMDLDLKPETIDSVEECCTEEPSEAFLYPDFLPTPFDTLDLHKLAFSKFENWKAAVDPQDSSTERLVTRLLELERLQHMTIQKERPRLPLLACGSAVSEHPSASKAAPKARPAKPPDAPSVPVPGVDKNRDKAKTSSASGKPEQNTSRWHCSDGSRGKWTPRPLPLRSPSTTKPPAATYDDTKNTQSPILNPCQEVSPKSSTTQTSQAPVKTLSKRYLPPRSPIPVSSVALSFPENHREEPKTPKTRKKLHHRTVLLKRPFYIQKLNYLSPFIGKGKCSLIDQK
ncbi:protein FAM217A [Cavia porcellus]|uniref:protein FAM217A n=1 Tax=Cavia porcellus TaxID=10141 RepID=UPI002FE13CC9